MITTNHLKFYEEMRQLCEKYNATISGCGCCGSPWVAFGRTIEHEELTATSQSVSIRENGKLKTVADRGEQ